MPTPQASFETKLSSAMSTVAPKVSPAVVEAFVDATIKEAHLANNNNRIAHMIGQTAHESGHFKKFYENLNYSASRLMVVWPKRFRSRSKAEQYARQPEKIANYVYGSRLGNSGKPGAGWKYRGRGPFMTTGYDNYEFYGNKIGVDLVNNPDLAAKPEISFRIGWHFMDNVKYLRKSLLEWADEDNVEAVTRGINGGFNGLEDRREYTTLAKLALYDGYPVVRRGDRGDIVSLAQAFLVEHGHIIAIDGDFGPKTDNAVRTFQTDYGMQVNGVIDKDMWHALGDI